MNWLTTLAWRLGRIRSKLRGIQPSEIQKEFGITITRQTVEYYDPRKTHHRSRDWADYEAYFVQQLKAYNKDLENCPAESRVYRQWLRTHLFEEAREQGNYSLALRILDSAQKECEGGFIKKTSRSKRSKFVRVIKD